MAVLSSPVAWILAILALGLLVIVHEGGHYLVARLCGMRVDRFSIGFGPTLLSVKRGETIFQIAAIPLGGFVQIAGFNAEDDTNDKTTVDPRLYRNRPAWQRFATIFAGPAINYLFATVGFLIVFLIWGIPVEGKRPLVGEVVASSPAASVGIEPGDEIVKIGTTDVSNSDQVPALINASDGKPIELKLIREGQFKTLTVTPQNGRIGIGMAHKEEWVQPGLGEQAWAALQFPYEKSGQVLSGLWQVITGKQPPRFQGPVGIVREMKKRMVLGAKYGIFIASLISVFLGLFNLLPFPALDGGRLIFLSWELVSRRRVNERVEQIVHAVGMFALLGLVLYITIFQDSGFFKGK